MKQTLLRYTAGCLFNVHFVPIACTNRKQWLQTQPSLYLLRYWTDLLCYRRQEAVEVQVLRNNSHRKNLDTQNQTCETWLSHLRKSQHNPLCSPSDAGIHLHAQRDTRPHKYIHVRVYVCRGKDRKRNAGYSLCHFTNLVGFQYQFDCLLPLSFLHWHLDTSILTIGYLYKW